MSRDVLRIIVKHRFREILGEKFKPEGHSMIIEACCDILQDGDCVLICDAIISRITSKEKAK